MNLMYFLIIVLIVMVCGIGVIAYYIWRWSKNKYLWEISSNAVHKAADALGVSDKKLDSPSMSGSSAIIYDLLLRIRNEEAFRMTVNAQLFAILASVAAIISAIGAIAGVIVAIYLGHAQ